MRCFKSFLIVALFIFIQINHASARQALPTPKYIFLISIDTLSAQHMSLFGYGRHTTPHIDRFAKESWVYAQALSQASYTMASHMTMMTGLYPYRHQILLDYNARLPAFIHTLPEVLRRHGYRTHALYDLEIQMLDPILGYGRGVDRFYSKDAFFTAKQNELLRLLTENKNGTHFYFIHTYALHAPYRAEPPFDRYFSTKKFKTRELKNFKRDDKTLLKKDLQIQQAKIWREQFDLTKPQDIENLKLQYDRAVAQTDERFGQFISLLKKIGIYDDSLIVLTSDHGEAFGEKGSFFHVYPSYKELHVPLIIRHPGARHRIFNERVFLTDIMPTVLDLAGIKSDIKFDGHSLVPDLKGEIKTHSRGVAVGFNSDSYFNQEWKFIDRTDADDELYKISEDRFETKNLITQYPQVAFEMKAESEKMRNSVYEGPKSAIKPAKKLYWFIPDGMRADPVKFNVFRWARQGELPNILRMMSEGSWGYSVPDFPSHTPINFASLLTGTHPEVHGIADGPMHIEGRPLAKPSAPGFSSVTKRVAPIWKYLYDQGKKIFLLSIPGSTPPEIPEIVAKGRWGNWGSDTTNMVFESESLLAKRKSLGNAFKLFFLGEPLTKFVPFKKIGAVRAQAVLAAHGAEIPIQVEYKTQTPSYVSFNLKDKTIKVKVGEWSDWHPIELKHKGTPFLSHFKISPIKIWKNADFRIRVLFNGLNQFNTEPGEISSEITQAIGPMVDHLDNWPPQLIFEEEDKRVSMDEVRMSLDWHRQAVSFITQKYKPDVFIQDTYTPNQMLESRWWQGLIDETRPGYDARKADAAMKDILEMYKGLDAVIGEMIDKKDEDTLIVLSSDHGVCPLHRLVHLNNLFAKKGWLKFTVDPKTGEASIDWKNTKVVYMKMLHVYINPNGLDGNWKRGSGPEFEKLREEVIATLKALKDMNGDRPLVKAVKWEDAKKVYKLPQDRIGDLVIEAKLNYFWYEEADSSGQIFSTPLTTGYKQSIDPEKNQCMWTPFVMWGPGVKKGFQIKKPILHVDQLPTIYKVMNIPIPKHVQGRVLVEALQ